jgi:tRNA dimethylallyltransferase
MSTAEASSGAGPRPPLALIAGPTASGKSDLAVQLALESRAGGREAVVINSDSAQVYRDLRVLSARPSVSEMRGVEHRLFGAWDGASACSAANWAAAARDQVEAAHRAGKLPILAGGTGLYIRTLLDGIAPVPPIDPDVRDEVRGMPQGDRFAALGSEDPEAAARLGRNDASRVARALEVVRSTGRPISEWQRERRGGLGETVDLRPLILLPDREALYARCDARFAAMLDGGAVEEVAALLARGLEPALPVMRAIGVREIAALLAGVASREETLAAGGQATRNYAKRQYTWLRHQPPASWPRVANDYNQQELFALMLRH